MNERQVMAIAITASVIFLAHPGTYHAHGSHTISRGNDNSITSVTTDTVSRANPDITVSVTAADDCGCTVTTTVATGGGGDGSSTPTAAGGGGDGSSTTTDDGGGGDGSSTTRSGGGDGNSTTTDDGGGDSSTTTGGGDDSGTATAGGATLAGGLESPDNDGYRSGIGYIGGWHCEAEVVEVVISGVTIETVTKTIREDTLTVCGDTLNGFGALYNWNRFGNGEHTVDAYADGVLFDTATFTVTTFGEEFLTGASGTFVLTDVANSETDSTIEWSQAEQNFVIVNPNVSNAGSTTNLEVGALENPGDGADKSGVGLISGWACNANEIVVKVDDVEIKAGYPSIREDTLDVCGDMNNGFGVLYNWNRFEPGTHTVTAYADGEEFASANFTTTHLGAEFVTGAEGVWQLANFPEQGTTTHVRWVEAIQNLVIYQVDQD